LSVPAAPGSFPCRLVIRKAKSPNPPMPPSLPLHPISRRRFLEQTVAGAAVLGFPAILRSQSSGSRLNLVIIGCGGRGASDMAEVISENIVALCDVNTKNLDAAAVKAPGAKKFRDFRKMYDELKDSEFDGVVVATTEHTHAFATLPA